MVSRTASASDVKNVIATDLADSEVNNYIDDAAYEADRAITDYTNKSTEDKTQLEKYYAALLIRTTRDKAVSSASRETASVDYESSTIAQLRQQVDSRDPSGTLAYQTDDSRYVNTA